MLILNFLISNYQNYIRLNALGQIPEDMKIEFIISDELGAEELYDIYIYTSDLKIEECDENFVFRPRAQEYQQFLIQVLNDRPFLDEDTIEPIATIGIQNLVKYGQFQAVTLAENPKTVISSSESIAENIFYFANVANTNEVEDVVADQLTIENTELIWNLESKPARYLSINAINKPNAVPNARYLALRFQNGNLFDAEDVLNLKPFIVSFQAKADQIIELMYAEFLDHLSMILTYRCYYYANPEAKRLAEKENLSLHEMDFDQYKDQQMIKKSVFYRVFRQ